jgi:SAM-dependent methyltransferase
MTSTSTVEPAPPPGADREQLRDHLHRAWAAVAGAWAEHATYADARGAALAERMLERVRPRPGERVLELACGPGGLGLAAAERVAPGGAVVRAARTGAAGVSARVLDLEGIDEPDGSYDVVLCREGLMFALDPARAVGEMERVLRRGGRLAIAVWGPRERNPWLGLVLDAVSAQLGRPVPPPGVPGPFSLQDGERLGGLLCTAGLADVELEEVAVPMRALGFDEWWERTCALAGPLARVLATLPAEAAAAVRARARAVVRPYETAGGLELPGVSLLASGRRA